MHCASLHVCPWLFCELQTVRYKKKTFSANFILFYFLQLPPSTYSYLYLCLFTQHQRFSLKNIYIPSASTEIHHMLICTRKSGLGEYENTICA